MHKQGLRSIWAPAADGSPTTDRFGLSANAPVQPIHGEGQGNGVPRNGGVDILPPLVAPVPTASLHALQEWEGYVTDIGDEEFGARLLDVTAGDAVEREDAVIPLEEVSAEDRLRMEPGSIFRWVIGYERSVGGTRRRVSQIVFLDLPAITDRDLERGREWADWLRAQWGLERTGSSGTGRDDLAPHDADVPEVWEQMLAPEPFAVLAPWRRGRGLLPTSHDVQRILSRTPHACASAKPSSSARKRPGTVSRTVRSTSTRLTGVIGSPGIVRLRRSLATGSPWRVKLFDPACPLSDLAA